MSHQLPTLSLPLCERNASDTPNTPARDVQQDGRMQDEDPQPVAEIHEHRSLKD